MKPESNGEKIWEIRKKGKMNIEIILNMEENCEMIWKIWKKVKLNNNKIQKIQKKIVK